VWPRVPGPERPDRLVQAPRRSATPRSWTSRSRPARRPGHPRCGSTPRGRRPPSPPRTTPGRSAGAATGCSGRTSPCAASGSSAAHPRPWRSAPPDATRCARWCGSRCVRTGRADRLGRFGVDQLLQRDPDRSRIRSVPSPVRNTSATRTRQTGTRPSVRSPSMSTWPYTPKNLADGPAKPVVHGRHDFLAGGPPASR
jgi:hypothetical protein